MLTRMQRALVHTLLTVMTFGALLAPQYVFSSGLEKLNISYLASYQTAYGLQSHDLAQSRLTVEPTVKTKLGKNWRFTMKAAWEIAGADTGLGTRETYAPMSRPIKLGPDARLEINELTLTRRIRHTQISLGKQTVAWGLLDGIRVTDQFSPVRFREFILTDYRPDRIGTWGARVKSRIKGFDVDVAATFDPTATQLAERDSVFAVTAARSRGGLSAAQSALVAGIPVIVDLPSGWRDKTRAGLRISKRLDGMRVSGQLITGPATDSVFELRGLVQGAPTVALTYPDRTLLGASLELPRGPVVWRFEGAYIGNETQNIKSAGFFERREFARAILGVGADWDGPHDVFVTGQMIVDYSKGDAAILLRHKKEVFATITLHRDFMQGELRGQFEYVGTLHDGDNVLRASVRYRYSDSVSLLGGADVISGNEDDLLGQFANADRLWFRTTVGF